VLFKVNTIASYADNITGTPLWPLYFKYRIRTGQPVKISVGRIILKIMIIHIYVRNRREDNGKG
jgi:hypothetical protein